MIGANNSLQVSRNKLRARRSPRRTHVGPRAPVAIPRAHDAHPLAKSMERAVAVVASDMVVSHRDVATTSERAGSSSRLQWLEPSESTAFQAARGHSLVGTRNRSKQFHGVATTCVYGPGSAYILTPSRCT